MVEFQVPHSIADAFQVLDSLLDEPNKAEIRHGEVIMFHHGLGRWIRNEFELWKGNPQLMTELGLEHPDDASNKLLELYQEHLREYR